MSLNSDTWRPAIVQAPRHASFTPNNVDVLQNIFILRPIMNAEVPHVMM